MGRGRQCGDSKDLDECTISEVAVVIGGLRNNEKSGSIQKWGLRESRQLCQQVFLKVEQKKGGS